LTQAAAYSLGTDRAIQHWLACGTIATKFTDLATFVDPNNDPFGDGKRWVINFWAFHPQSTALKLRIYESLSFDWQPDERPILHHDAIGGKQWRYRRAAEDQVIDFSRFNLNPSLMEGWLYAGLESPHAQRIHAELLTIGPARVWLNGAPILHYAEMFSYVALQAVPVTLNLSAGWNDLYLYGAMLGWREARLALGLRFVEDAPLTVKIPIGEVSPEKWANAEQGLDALRVEQFAFPQLPGYLSLASDAEPFAFEAAVTLAIPDLPWAKLDDLQLPQAVARYTLKAGERAQLPISQSVLESMASVPGENSLSLTLRPTDGTPIEVRHIIWASSRAFSHAPYGDYESRRQEAREHLARMPQDVLAAVAAVETGLATHIDSDAVRLACAFLQNRYDCADFYAIELLALLYRYANTPPLLPADQTSIETTFRDFKFWIDEPGLDGMCYFTENHQILFHVTAYLTGQLYPDWIFSNSGWSGKTQMERNRPRIEAWILRRLRGGFSEWDSNAYMALDAFAMLALVEFAAEPRLQELAATLLHKIFFMVACQSFRGVLGSTHGRCYVEGLKCARFENTSSLGRIGWGMGIFNGETRATGLLALARRYRLPEVIQKIGADVDTELLTRARSYGEFIPESDMHGGYWDVRTLTYRNADVMLSAALDYRPGEVGIQEHLWQATLSPEAVVFTTYPGNSQQHGNARPNFWAGSVRLPRVGMHGKTVICLYQLEKGVGLGFSHAYFPAKQFDEYEINGQWALARFGAGCVALWGDGALQMTTSGQHAGQELRSSGRGAVWLCYVGGGDFADFRRRVLAHPPQLKDLGVSWQTPEGEEIAFAWQGALTVDGQAQDWERFPHYENAYTHTTLDDAQMHIRFGGETLTLDLT